MTGSLRLLMVVQSPQIARFVAANGVDRLFIDLETMGKAERQAHMASWKSTQSPQDITRIREAVPDGHILMRINPLHAGSRAEIDDAIARGADSIMLPMFRTTTCLDRFFHLVGDRVQTVPLFETAEAVRLLPAIAGHPLLREAHIGLNDLHLDLGQRFLFEPIADGTLEEGCAALCEAGVPFGIGGVGRAGEGGLPPENLLGEHVRLGSTCAILSQAFHRNAQSLEDLQKGCDFATEVEALQQIYRGFRNAGEQALEENRLQTVAKVRDVVRTIESAARA